VLGLIFSVSVADEAFYEDRISPQPRSHPTGKPYYCLYTIMLMM
jgi:hypothetical protein